MIVELKTERTIQTPQYFLISKKDEKENNNDFPCFEMQEKMITQTSIEYLFQKKIFPNPEVKALPEDIFNLKTNFSVKSFEDIVRLNNAQKNEIEKYSLFGEALLSKPALKILYENTIVLNKLLNEIFDETLNPKNNMSELKEMISNVNKNCKKLNVQFYTEDEFIAAEKGFIYCFDLF